MPYEVYVPKRRLKGSRQQPYVSLSKSSIVLSKHARATLNCDVLELAYDVDRRILRIRPGAGEAGIPLKKTKVLAHRFFKEFGITKTGKFVPEYDDKENALFVQL